MLISWNIPSVIRRNFTWRDRNKRALGGGAIEYHVDEKGVELTFDVELYSGVKFLEVCRDGLHVIKTNVSLIAPRVNCNAVRSSSETLVYAGP